MSSEPTAGAGVSFFFIAPVLNPLGPFSWHPNNSAARGARATAAAGTLPRGPSGDGLNPQATLPGGPSLWHRLCAAPRPLAQGMGAPVDLCLLGVLQHPARTKGWLGASSFKRKRDCFGSGPQCPAKVPVLKAWSQPMHGYLGDGGAFEKWPVWRSRKDWGVPLKGVVVSWSLFFPGHEVNTLVSGPKQQGQLIMYWNF